MAPLLCWMPDCDGRNEQSVQKVEQHVRDVTQRDNDISMYVEVKVLGLERSSRRSQERSTHQETAAIAAAFCEPLTTNDRSQQSAMKICADLRKRLSVNI